VNGPSIARLLWLVLPLLGVGLFARVYYTPDEPREASLVVAMASQADKSLPELAGQPFAEKPPLLYWLGGGAVAALGSSPAATRLPNLAYALIAVLSIGALARRAAGPAAGFTAGAVVATMLQLYQGLIWLATDAPLIAGVALALEGMHRGLMATLERERLRGYLVMYAGLALAFFAKGFAGWMVPVFAMATVVVLEGRWRELVRPALWAGLPLLGAGILAWVWAVSQRPGGAEALRVLFWYNLVGRALAIDAPRAYAYASGHANSPGKYLLELPMYLLPWTFLAIGAARRLLPSVLAPDATAVRLAVGAIVPATVLLSLAATARGVYYTPPLLGFALLIGLYAGSDAANADWLIARLTACAVALLAIVLGAFAVLACWAPAERSPVAVAGGAIALLGSIGALWLVARPAEPAARFARQALGAACVLTFVAGPLYLRLNGWLSLEAIAARISSAAGQASLVVLHPDETTIALAHLYLPHDGVVLVENDAVDGDRARTALANGARLVWQAPGSGRWNAARWRAFLGFGGPVRDAASIASPTGFGALRLECAVERAGGRTYAVFAAADAARNHAARCDAPGRK
jgi:4-amino-4-deoxy-L-arabinose transferase-like glycosyltransferase